MDPDQDPPDLIAAVIDGDEQAVRRMLAANPQAAAATHIADMMALHFAAVNANCGVAQLILAAAPETISARSLGLMPLHFAAVNGASALVQLLVEADPAGACVADEYGSTPLHAALQGLQDGGRHESYLATARCLVQAAQTVQPALDALNEPAFQHERRSPRRPGASPAAHPRAVAAGSGALPSPGACVAGGGGALYC